MALSKEKIQKIREMFTKNGLPFLRMISLSKSSYYNLNPNNFIIFNARIYDKKTFEKNKKSKIRDFFKGQEIELWYGDLDLNIDIKKLKKLSMEIGTLVITNENGQKICEIDPRERE